MIESIQIGNFKSYREADLPLSPLTLLIGANASGKSNAIEAIRFLSWLAEGRRLDDIMSAVHEADMMVRGSIEDLRNQTDLPFRLGCRLTDPEWNLLSVAIAVRPDEGLRIEDERVTGTGIVSSAPLYAVVAPAQPYSHDLAVQYNNFLKGGKKPRITCTDQQAVFTQLETPARFAAIHVKAQEVIPEVVRRFRSVLDDVLFLDPSPRRMRGYSFILDRKLKGDGSNLSSVLYHLCRELEMKDEVLGFVTELPEQRFLDIQFTTTSRREVMVQLTESFAQRSRTWDAPVLSDGTLRVLAVAAALLSAPAGSLVIIEEIDNGVHPSRARSLLANIEAVARRRGLRVLLTTHNPALLDALPASAVPDVVCCYRDPDQGDSRLLRLAELPAYPELVARGPLGQLMTRGVIDFFLKNQRSAEQRRAASRQWLETLQAQVEGV